MVVVVTVATWAAAAYLPVMESWAESRATTGEGLMLVGLWEGAAVAVELERGFRRTSGYPLCDRQCSQRRWNRRCSWQASKREASW